MINQSDQSEARIRSGQDAGPTQPAFRVRHALPGRLRLAVTGLRGHPGRAGQLRTLLQKDHQNLHFRVNPGTGSVLIVDPQAQPGDLLPRVRFSLERALGTVLTNGESPAMPDPVPAREDQGREPLWWALTVSHSLKAQLVDQEFGLPPGEVETRLLRFGYNKVQEQSRPSTAEMLRRQVANSQTAMLLGSAALSAATGGLIDVVMIGGVLTMNGVIGFVTENRAENIISTIGRIPVQVCKVIRGGQQTLVQDHMLVPGDLVVLEAGLVPADMRLIKSKRLNVDESALTGEGMPVRKVHKAALDEKTALADRVNMVWRGTVITSGQGLGLVVATGNNTEIGRVSRLAGNTRKSLSPIQKNLDELGRQTVVASGVLCGGVFLVGLARGHRFIDILSTSIALTVAAVPEGLPAIGTSTMALAVKRLGRQGILTRRLSVVETLGSVDVICLDKTGTLTCNKMQVEVIRLPKRLYDQQGLGKAALATAKHPDLVRLLAVAGLCNDSLVREGQWEGSATELSLVDAAVKGGLDVAALRSGLPRFKTRYRTEKRQYMATYHATSGADAFHLPRAFAAVKGNPVQLVAMCRYQMVKGKLVDFGPEERLRVLQQNEELAGGALRILGFAYGVLPGQGEYRSVKDLDLVWLGLAGLKDPTRDGMGELIRTFHEAGIRTIMMTGDQTATARAIGRELHLNHNGDDVRVMDAGKINGAYDDLLEEVQVFSRVSPTEKLKIVKALQKQGHIVAMTGDGINDSPALKAANVGIAMGKYGTTAARESADLVLINDDLHLIPGAISQGRTIRANLRRSIRFLLATNFSEIMVMFTSIAMGRGSPLNPMQLLWINMLTDVFPALALALEKPRDGEIRGSVPDDPSTLFSSAEKKEILVQAGILTAASLGAWEWSFRRNGDEARAGTLAFTSLTTNQMLYALNVATRGRLDMNGLITLLRSNKTLGLSIAASLALVLAGVRLPRIRQLLKNQMLDIGDLGVSAGSSALTFFINELFKKPVSIKGQNGVNTNNSTMEDGYG